MNNSVLLYIVNMLTYDHDAYGGVGLADVAKWLGASKPTAQKQLRNLCEYGVVREVKKAVPRGVGFRYEYVVTPQGAKVIEDDHKIIQFQFKAWQNEKLNTLLHNAAIVSKPRGKPKKASVKQMKLDI